MVRRLYDLMQVRVQQHFGDLQKPYVMVSCSCMQLVLLGAYSCIGAQALCACAMHVFLTEDQHSNRAQMRWFGCQKEVRMENGCQKAQQKPVCDNLSLRAVSFHLLEPEMLRTQLYHTPYKAAQIYTSPLKDNWKNSDKNLLLSHKSSLFDLRIETNSGFVWLRNSTGITISGLLSYRSLYIYAAYSLIYSLIIC